ncbi:hypothetical protein BH23ACT6_BH23ACT6_26170 [soil metagenome]
MNDTNEMHDTTEFPHQEAAAAHQHAAPPAGADSTARPEPIRPTGISWVTVVLGIACLGFAATVLTLQWSDLAIAWTVVTPAFVVGAGVLLLLAGAAGVVRGRSDEELHLE